MNARTGIDRRVATLNGPERASLRAAMHQLQRLPAQSSPEGVFRAIARCVPVAGGIIGTLGGESPSSPVSHVVKLPPAVLEGWASTPREHLGRMLAPMMDAAPGELISDSQAIVGRFREELDLLRDLRDAGLGESAGYKVSTRRGGSGAVEHRFLTFALERGATFTAHNRAALAVLQPIIHAALDRLGVPLIASRSILSQVMDEQSIGFMCVSPDGTIIELNERMHCLATRYLVAARVDAGRGALARFAGRVMGETVGSRIWQLRHEDGRALVEISGHWLAKETHATGEDLVLVMMREVSLAPPPPVRAPRAALTNRQWEVARLLAESGLSYKQIADRLDISGGTMRKHVENVYRSLGVHSRAELALKLR
jgi:DNA-binding CsgD family transcriptional regulator